MSHILYEGNQTLYFLAEMNFIIFFFIQDLIMSLFDLNELLN